METLGKIKELVENLSVDASKFFEKENIAATNIQSQWKGHQTRKKLTEKVHSIFFQPYVCLFLLKKKNTNI